LDGSILLAAGSFFQTYALLHKNTFRFNIFFTHQRPLFIRLIERSEHAPFIEQNRLNIEADPATYKKRQAIIEHTYGIIKRQWGFYFISTKKGIKRASADVGFMMVIYNLRRLINIIGTHELKKFFKELGFFYSKILFSPKAQSFVLTILDLRGYNPRSFYRAA